MSGFVLNWETPLVDFFYSLKSWFDSYGVGVTVLLVPGTDLDFDLSLDSLTGLGCVCYSTTILPLLI